MEVLGFGNEVIFSLGGFAKLKSCWNFLPQIVAEKDEKERSRMDKIPDSLNQRSQMSTYCMKIRCYVLIDAYLQFNIRENNLIY